MLALPRVLPMPGEGSESGVVATAQALEALLREGRPEFKDQPWVPHRPPRPEKSEGGQPLVIKSDFAPKGDQPQAITELVEGVSRHDRTQVLLGVTGSGKTFTMAKVIEATQRPALILAPNKTLAAQLYGEFRSFFPDNAVEYFVSYYDYYQPEAYVPRTDTYIEKESSINEQIDRMRHSATRSLLERDDVIIVASVSCIYGIGSVETYTAMTFAIKQGERIDQRRLVADLVALQYKRTLGDFARGTFRVRGDTVDIFPAHYEDRAWRVNLFGDEVESIEEFDPLTGHKTDELKFVKIYANSHYVTPRPTLLQAIAGIKHELRWRLDQLNATGRLLEAQRLEQRTLYDLEMMEATGSCAGIENYSRYLTGRRPGEPPPTLFEYVPDNALVFMDESHVTVPQLGGMYRGDFRRKATLAEYGFRLPSCMDNRPLRFEEWDAMRPQSVAVSATPAGWELDQSGGVFVEQVIRPTGLIDPPVDIRPARTQVDDLVGELRRVAAEGYRALITVLTKRMAEDLTEYLHEQGIRVRYMHSDIDTIERIEIIRDLRLGAFDALVGINLLREGPRHPGMRAGRDPRCRQGGLPAQRDLADPDHRPRRAQRRRQGDPLCRRGDRLDGARHRRDQPSPREAGRVQPGERHHAGEREEAHRRHPRQRLRARPRAGGDRQRGHVRRRRRRDRPQFRDRHRRPRNADARSGGRPQLRGGGAAARRGQASARDRARGGRRSDRADHRRHRRAAARRASRASTRWVRGWSRSRARARSARARPQAARARGPGAASGTDRSSGHRRARGCRAVRADQACSIPLIVSASSGWCRLRRRITADSASRSSWASQQRWNSRTSFGANISRTSAGTSTARRVQTQRGEVGDAVAVGELDHAVGEAEHLARDLVEDRRRARRAGAPVFLVRPRRAGDRHVAAAGEAPPQRLAIPRLVDRGLPPRTPRIGRPDWPQPLRARRSAPRAISTSVTRCRQRGPARNGGEVVLRLLPCEHDELVVGEHRRARQQRRGDRDHVAGEADHDARRRVGPRRQPLGEMLPRRRIDEVEHLVGDVVEQLALARVSLRFEENVGELAQQRIAPTGRARQHLEIGHRHL